MADPISSGDTEASIVAKSLLSGDGISCAVKEAPSSSLYTLSACWLEFFEIASGRPA